MNVELLCDIVGKADKNFELALVPAETLKKFAELIIRECALVVFKNTGPKSALNVLEHFGLKDEE